MDKQRKVLFIIDTIQGSGAERSLVEIARNFQNYIPVFAHIYKGDMLRPDLESSGISVYSLNIDKKHGFKEAVEKLTPLYIKEKPDIVHSTLFRADMVARKMKRKFPEIPLIGSFVNNSYNPSRYENKSLLMKLKLWIAYKMDKISAKGVDFYISNSETIKAAEGSALNIPSNKIEVIHRGRDMKKYNLKHLEKIELLKKELKIEDKNVLINVSRLIERKAQLDLIKSLPAVLKVFPETVLLIAGHGDYEKILKNKIKELNLEDYVQLLGRRQDVPVLLDLSTLFLYPSYAEGLPGALIEAMMSEKIIVASNISENMECINSDSALIFEKGNIDDLTRCIVYALNNLSEVQAKGLEARTQASEKFEIGAIARKYEEVYERQLIKQV